jgi:uncharacterized protein YacL
MIDALIILLFILAGATMGFLGIDLLPTAVLEQASNVEGLRFVSAGFAALASLALGLIVQTSLRRLQRQMGQLPAEVLVSRAVGLILGLLIANLILAPVFLLPIPWEFAFIKPLAAVLSSIIFGFVGVTLADTHGRPLIRFFNPNSVETSLVAEGTLKPAITKILDTSCIIDGRIAELLDTGFLEGQLIVPRFVLQELQQVADSTNDQKRARGRRGLDVLNRLRDSYGNRIVVNNTDYDDLPAVDAKLVRLAQEIGGELLTTDYNLNKVAQFEAVKVLNINELAKVLRPTYLPGDRLNLRILKEGKEVTQGVGYLEDGTMVVVEDGRPHIGSQLEVVVTGALQTAAGRMIFARPLSSVVA